MSDLVTRILDLVVRFADSGRLGPLHCGMALQNVEELIGPFHDRMHDSKPRRWRPRLHFWHDLEVLICHGLVVEVSLPLWRESVTLPDALGGGNKSALSRLTISEVLNALDATGCAWKEAPALVLDNEARGVRTVAHDVHLVFGPESCDTGVLRLHKIYKADPDVDQENHSPRQGKTAS